MQKNNLFSILKMIVPKEKFCHYQLENILGISLEPPSTSSNSCPKYSDELSKYKISVWHSDLSKLLTDTFISDLSGLITPIILIDKLSIYPDVGQLIYNIPRGLNPPALLVLTTIILHISRALLYNYYFSTLDLGTVVLVLR